jgi:hypothetical protein
LTEPKAREEVARGLLSLDVDVCSRPPTKVDETIDATVADSGFRFDPTAQQWIFNVSNSGQYAGYTYVYSISLNDGTNINFQYGLR